jgi:hypothetical protein
MSRIRSIHPGIWTDEAFMEASAHARLLIFGIWNEAWDDGVFEWKPLTIKARIFPVDAVDVGALLAELENLQFVRKFQANGKDYGAIRNFQKYQRPKKPNSSGVLPNSLCSWVASSEPVPNQYGTSGEKSPQMEDVGGRMEKEKEEASASSLAAAAEKKQLDEIASALEDATGWVLPGVHLIRDLVSEGHSLTERVVPLAAESAASRRRLGKNKPESWAYLATIVRDNYREPARASKATKAAQDLVKVPQSSAAWGLAADRYKRERGKPPPVVDGASWFEPRYLATSEAAA